MSDKNILRESQDLLGLVVMASGTAINLLYIEPSYNWKGD